MGAALDRAGGSILAPAPLPQPPALTRLTRSYTVPKDHVGAAAFAATLIERGAVARSDWEPGGTAASLIEAVVGRHIQHLNRNVDDPIWVTAFVRPWADYLAELDVDTEPGERRWALGLDVEDGCRIEVRPLLDALGTAGTGAVLHGLLAFAPVFVASPTEFEWIVDGWRDAADSEKTDESIEIAARAEMAATLTDRIEALLQTGQHAPAEAVTDRRTRRLLAVLAALSRSDLHVSDRESPWRETQEVDWNLPRPVVEYVWEDGCALNHAAEEARFLAMQDGGFPQPQQMWLLDPNDPEDAWAAWSCWIRSLRQLRVMSRIVAHVQAITPHPNHHEA